MSTSILTSSSTKNWCAFASRPHLLSSRLLYCHYFHTPKISSHSRRVQFPKVHSNHHPMLTNHPQWHSTPFINSSHLHQLTPQPVDFAIRTHRSCPPLRCPRHSTSPHDPSSPTKCVDLLRARTLTNSPHHQDPNHTHLESHCKPNNCAACNCQETKKPHCSHCFHCMGCSCAVSRGCRACAYSPETGIYRSYTGGRRQGDSDEEVVDFEFDGTVGGKEGRRYPYRPQIHAVSTALTWWRDAEGKIVVEGESWTPPGSPAR